MVCMLIEWDVTSCKQIASQTHFNTLEFAETLKDIFKAIFSGGS